MPKHFNSKPAGRTTTGPTPEQAFSAEVMISVYREGEQAMKKQQTAENSLSNIGAILVGKIAEASSKLDTGTQAVLYGYIDGLILAREADDRKGA